MSSKPTNALIPVCDETHDPSVDSFLADSAPHGSHDGELFPIQNLPLAVCRSKSSLWIGTLVHGQVVNLSAAVERGHLSAPFTAQSDRGLAAYMSCPAEERRRIRRSLFALLRRGSPVETTIRELVVPLSEITTELPAPIGDYTDFYASISHAKNVGALFRPDEPLLPNYKHLPVAYHGRSSSIVAGDARVIRPAGQRKAAPSAAPEHGLSTQLDYELELGLFIGPGNPLGTPISIDRAAEQLAGFVLLNDWSARDIQSWEYQPLGPFLGKNFMTSISPWMITSEALAPFFTERSVRAEDDPPLLRYLIGDGTHAATRLDIELEVLLRSEKMRAEGADPLRLSRTSSATLYWSFEQMVAHHTVNGCNLRPGDLLGSGTISGAGRDQRGCLLELAERGKSPVSLPDGSSRSFLEGGDELTLRGTAKRDGFRAIGFGDLRGTVQ